MNKTLDQTSKTPNQTYRTSEENQQAFRPRYDPQQSKTTDASRDVESLMASKASMTKQEHAVSAGMAKRMASDHLMSLNDDINFINDNMGDLESRDTAILKLQSSIASTAGVAEGLSGDTAMAYDQAYIGSARKMAGGAISAWKSQQKAIDKDAVAQEFQRFLNSSHTMDGEASANILQIWKGRLEGIEQGGGQKAVTEAASSVAKQLLVEMSEDPSLSSQDRLDRLKGKSLMGLADISPDGMITYNTDNHEANYILSKALGPIVLDPIKDKATRDKTVSAAMKASSKSALGLLKREHTAVLARFNATEDKAEKAKLKTQLDTLAAEMKGYEPAEVSQTFVDKLVKIESVGSYTAHNKKSGAYGKYQFMPSTLKEYAKKTGQTIAEARTPSGQDKMFKRFTEDNAAGLSKRGYMGTELNLWIAHNQGLGGFDEIMGTGPLSKKAVRNIKSNLPTGMDATRENYISYWGRKFSNGQPRTSTATREISESALAKVKAGLAQKGSDDKTKKTATSDMDTNIKKGYKELIEQASIDGDYEAVKKYMEETQSAYSIMTGGDVYFDDIDMKTVARLEREFNKDSDKKLYDDEMSSIIDAKIAGGMPQKQAIEETMDLYRDRLKDKTFASIKSDILYKDTKSGIEENTGQNIVLSDREAISMSSHLTPENLKQVALAGMNLKRPEDRIAVMAKVDKYQKSMQYQLDSTYFADIGTYSIDIPRLSQKEKTAFLDRESFKISTLFDNMSNKVLATRNSSTRLMGEILNGTTDIPVDSQVIKHFVNKEIVQYTNSPESFMAKYGQNEEVLGHSSVKVAINELSIKDKKLATKYSAFSILAKNAKDAGKQDIFNTPEESALFMHKLNNIRSKESIEEYESNDAYKDFLSKWEKYPGVQYEDKEEILTTAAALVLAGQGQLLNTIQEQVFSKYTKVRKLGVDTAQDGISFIGALKTDYAFYSNETLIDVLNRNSNADLEDIIVQAIAKDTGRSYKDSVKYMEGIDSSGATFTYDPVSKEYSIVLEDSNNPGFKTRIPYIPNEHISRLGTDEDPRPKRSYR